MSSVPVPPGGPKYFLPMWRWSSPTSSLHANLGVGLSDQIQGGIANLAGYILTVANFSWQIAAELIGFVADPQNNLAANGALLGSINRFVADIGGGLVAGPIPWVILSFALIGLAIGYLRGRFSVSSAIRCVLCLTFLTIMVSAAGSGSPGSTAGSPSWVINKGVGISNVLSNSAAGQLQNVHQTLQPFGGGVPAPNCATYVAALEQQAQANGAAPVDVGLSDLWDHAFLPQWARVQFGVDGEAFKASCHYLENSADPGPVDASNTVQSQIGAAAGYPAGPVPKPGGVYGPWQDDDSMERGMMAWAWCDSAGGWHTDPDFVAAEQSRGADGTECQKWWTQTGTGVGGQTNKIRPPAGNGAFDNHNFPNSNTYAHQFIAWFDGHFTDVAIILAICALLAALGFGWMFIGLALMVLFAQLGLLILLFLAPVLLLVMAWPGEGAGKVPGSVARLFALCLGAKALFFLILAGLISLFEILDDLLATNYGSVGSAIMAAIIPLVAIAVSYVIAKKLGVNNVLSPKGAFKVASSAGTKALKVMGGGGSLGGLGPRRDREGGREQPRSTNDPERPRDRPGGRGSGIAAATQRIRDHRAGVGQAGGMDSPAVMAARRKALAARAPDTTGMAPGEFAASKGFAIGPARPKRPEEIRNWNAGEGVAGRTPEMTATVLGQARELLPPPGASSGKNQFVGDHLPPPPPVPPGRQSNGIITVFARDERGPGQIIRDPLWRPPDGDA